jgi:O-antigen ligase
LHGEYYKWFRDVAMGKITDMQTGFFRIVLPEHLLIAPLALIIGSLLMRDEKHHKMWRLLICACMAIIAVNLSRAYMLGIVAAMPILAYKHKIKEWVKESAFIFLSFLIVFCGISLISTNFKSFGFELLGVRIQSFAKPQIEDSTYTRMALLKPISLMIQAHPILGNGIGSQVIFIDPIIKKMVKTPNFDWGYLEMWAELGIIGTALYVSIIFIILFELIKKIRMVSDWHDFYVGILAASVCLLVINFTAPALFHVCGVLFFVFVSAYILKPLTIFEYTINILYRIFNKGS